MKHPRHTVYTRCSYDDDRLFQLRLAVSARTSIPSMAAQDLLSPVRWAWLCHERHRDAIESAVRAGGWRGEIELRPTRTGPLPDVRESGDDIQTRLDDDDWIAPTFLDTVQHYWSPDLDGPRFRYWDPILLALDTGQWFDPGPKSWPSMFVSLYAPTRDVHVFGAPHQKIGQLGYPVDRSPEPLLCCLVIHSRNRFSALKRPGRPIPPPPGAEVVR